MKRRWLVLYHGAPYGDNEDGHIVSRHSRLDLAAKRCLGHGHGQCVAYLSDDGAWVKRPDDWPASLEKAKGEA